MGAQPIGSELFNQWGPINGVRVIDINSSPKPQLRIAQLQYTHTTTGHPDPKVYREPNLKGWEKANVYEGAWAAIAKPLSFSIFTKSYAVSENRSYDFDHSHFSAPGQALQSGRSART